MDVFGLAGFHSHIACGCISAINEHVQQHIARLTIIGHVDIDVDGATVMHMARHGDIIDGVVVHACGSVAHNGALVTVDGHLDIIAFGTGTGTPVVHTVLGIHGHDAVGATRYAFAKDQLTVGVGV